MEKSIAAQQAGRRGVAVEARQTVHRRGSCAVGLGLGQPRLVSARLLVSCSYIGYYAHEVVVPKIYASGRKQSSGWGCAGLGRTRRMVNLACHGLNEDKHSSLALRSCVTSQGGRKWTMTVNGSSRDADTHTHTAAVSGKEGEREREAQRVYRHDS